MTTINTIYLGIAVAGFVSLMIGLAYGSFVSSGRRDQ